MTPTPPATPLAPPTHGTLFLGPLATAVREPDEPRPGAGALWIFED